MMQEPLPKELRELERRLEGRWGGEPSGALRGRVMRAVERGLADKGGRPARRGLTWSYAAAAAAAVILGMNLSMEAVSVTRFVEGRGMSVEEVELAAESIRRVVPELGAAEARRAAVMMTSGGRLVAAPAPRGSGGGLAVFSFKEP